MNNLLEYKDYVVNWIKEKVKEAGARGVIVGISGGVDSSVVAAMAKEAFPNNSLGVYLPIGEMGQDLQDAQDTAEVIGIKTTMVNLTKSFEETNKAIGVKTRLAVANIKPRLRMAALYALAQEHGYLVLGTDNAAEWLLGYFTKYGDGGVDLLPLLHLTKGEVKALAKELNLPKNVYTKAPTAALWDGQTDEEELGFTYDDVDKYINGEKIDNEIKAKIEKQIKSTEHKRNPLPSPLSKTMFSVKQTGKEIEDGFKEVGKKIKDLFK